LSLTVKIFSFSYIYGSIPDDESGNGGGFVYDCRFIYNPGKMEEFWDMTGKDKEVIKFLDERKDMQEFLNSVFKITDSVIENYLERNFTDLMLSFGCTGGQHRSVYAAEKTGAYLKEKFPQIEVVVSHNEYPGL
jgi:UPF0042 nucleotide-binding protein